MAPPPLTHPFAHLVSHTPTQPPLTYTQASSSSEEESDSGDESDTDSDPAASSSSEDLANPALPTPAALAAAAALAAGRAPSTGVSFATHLVGEGGAGYLWPAADPVEEAYASLAPPPLR
jgi:hypothetical protein